MARKRYSDEDILKLLRELHLLTRARDTPSPATAAFAKFVAEWSTERT